MQLTWRNSLVSRSLYNNSVWWSETVSIISVSWEQRECMGIIPFLSSFFAPKTSWPCLSPSSLITDWLHVGVHQDPILGSLFSYHTMFSFLCFVFHFSGWLFRFPGLQLPPILMSSPLFLRMGLLSQAPSATYPLASWVCVPHAFAVQHMEAFIVLPNLLLWSPSQFLRPETWNFIN